MGAAAVFIHFELWKHIANGNSIRSHGIRKFNVHERASYHFFDTQNDKA